MKESSRTMTKVGSEQLELAVELDRLSQALGALQSNDQITLDQHQRTALDRLQAYLKEMAEECRSGKLRSSDERYGYVARLVVEMDPSIIRTELGGQLIEVERRYRAL